MTDAEFDALIDFAFRIEPIPDFEDDVDISVLTDEDREALDALGDDLIDRLIARNSQATQ